MPSTAMTLAANAPHDIPEQPHELSVQWLTTQLRASNTIGPEAEVRSFDYTPPSAGNAMSGVTVRLRLGYDQDRPGQPATVIAKFAAADPVVKGMLEAADTYGREIAFYRDLQQQVPIPSPRFCGGGCDPAPAGAILQKLQRIYDYAPAAMHGFTARRPEKLLRASKRRYALLLEDVGEDAVVHDLITPPPAALLLPVVAQLADLHAHFWGQHELADHPALQPPLGQLPRFYRNALDRLCRDMANERFAGWLTPAHHA
ncbi:MAG: hypothetical protein KJO17_06685, partial [Acidimicrobiia bacterium]|nr:hypothetical protein [Acidimicrobiia bacterium]